MTLLNELQGRIKDMSQAEQKLLLARLTAKEPIIDYMPTDSLPDELEEQKDNLAYLAFAAIDNDVPKEVVINGAFHIFCSLMEASREKRETNILKFKRVILLYSDTEKIAAQKQRDYYF